MSRPARNLVSAWTLIIVVEAEASDVVDFGRFDRSVRLITGASETVDFTPMILNPSMHDLLLEKMGKV